MNGVDYARALLYAAHGTGLPDAASLLNETVGPLQTAFAPSACLPWPGGVPAPTTTFSLGAPGAGSAKLGELWTARALVYVNGALVLDAPVDVVRLA